MSSSLKIEKLALLLLFAFPVISYGESKEVAVPYPIEYPDGSVVESRQHFSESGVGSARLSDEDVLKYASSSYDKAGMMWKRIVLGKHEKLPLVAEFPCSDLCPANTTRVIRYDIQLSDCEQRGGVVKYITVPVLIAAAPVRFCVPKILAEHWGDYIR